MVEVPHVLVVVLRINVDAGASITAQAVFHPHFCQPDFLFGNCKIVSNYTNSFSQALKIFFISLLQKKIKIICLKLLVTTNITPKFKIVMRNEEIFPCAFGIGEQVVTETAGVKQKL